jgi:hypothetical protein
MVSYPKFMISRAYTVGWLVLAATCTPSASLAAPTSVQKVKQLYERLYFKEARLLCDASLEAGRLHRADLLQLLEYKALIAASSGKELVAVDTFRRLLSVEPKFTLGKGHAPRIRRALAAARRWLTKRSPISAVLRAPRQASARRTIPFRLEVGADPLALVARAALYIRAAGQSRFRVYPLQGDYSWQIKPPLSLRPEAPWVEYYVAAQDRDHNELVLIGSGAEPNRVRILGLTPFASRAGSEAPPRRSRATPLVQRWWFWTVIGAVVIGAGVGLGVGLGTRRPAEAVDAPVVLEAGR